MFPHSLWRLVGHTVLSWLQAEYSHLQWGYSSLWHFPKELTALMVFRLSKGLFLFCPVHCVEKTPRRVSHCLSNIFNPIYCGHVSHSTAWLSLVTWAHAHTYCTRTHSNVWIYTLKRAPANKHAPNQRNRCHFVTSLAPMSLWRWKPEGIWVWVECETSRTPIFEWRRHRRIKLSPSVCTPPTLCVLLSEKDTGGCTKRDLNILIVSPW